MKLFNEHKPINNFNMKAKLMGVIIILLIISPSNGQNYIPFPYSNAIWSVVTYWNNPDPPPLYWDYWTDHFGMTDDTLINNITYCKIESNNDSVFNSEDISNIYEGAIRSNNETRKVFFVPPDSLTEFLLYDFNIEVSQTITSISFFGATEIFCYYKDSVFINGNFYDYYYLSINLIQIGWDVGTNWIEGIGSTKTLLETYYPLQFDLTRSLLCLTVNDSLIYHQQFVGTDGCYLKMDTSTSVNEMIQSKVQNPFVQVLPNPVTCISSIQTNIPIKENCFAEIINIRGEIIARFKVIELDKIYSTKIPNGFYLLKLSDGASFYLTKFIVNKI